MDAYYDSVATHRLRRAVCLISFRNPLSQAVGRAVAALTGLSLVIVDEALEHRFGASAHEIVPDAGLDGWRRAEAREIERALDAEPRCLLVLGEGALTDRLSRELVVERSVLVYLREDLGEIQRGLETVRSPKHVTLFTEAASIPGEPADQLEALLGLRTTEYCGAALAIDAGGRPPRRIAREVAEKLETEGVLERL